MNFFSLSADLILINQPLPYDLYINSSSLESRQRFVRIFRKGEPLSHEELKNFLAKYRQLYLAEEERGAFLKTLNVIESATDKVKTEVIKDSTIRRLKTLFETEHTGEALSETLSQARDCVDSMIDVLHDYTVDQLQEMISTLGFHDAYTYDHSINVAMYAILIYKLVDPKAPREMLVQAGLGGLFHDLGKIKLPTAILNNSGKLSDAEYALIKKHPQDGYDMLNSGTQLKLPPGVKLDLISRVVLEHHENYDGSGYPRKIAGEKIHLLSRVVSIADFFDAITTKRSYHEPLPVEEALLLMSKSAGTKLDIDLFEMFERYARSAEHQHEHPDEPADLGLQLPCDFDPCQPQKELPWVLSSDEEEGYGKIRIIESTKPKQKGTKKRA